MCYQTLPSSFLVQPTLEHSRRTETTLALDLFDEFLLAVRSLQHVDESRVAVRHDRSREQPLAERDLDHHYIITRTDTSAISIIESRSSQQQLHTHGGTGG